jgi:hypothetical protein
MKTKRIFVVMLVLLLVVTCSFAMFACNKNNSSDEPSGDGGGEVAPVTPSHVHDFDFSDDENNAHLDFVGDRVIDIGSADTLKYAGLLSPFEEDFYILLSNYFVGE